MPRGKTQTTKMKEAIINSLPVAEAVIIAREKVIAKLEKNKKPEERIKDYIYKWAEKIDPVKAVAILGTTYVIKQGIQWTEDIITRANLDLLFTNPFTGFFPGLIDIFNKRPTNAELKNILNSPQAELLEWLLSFTIAFLIVENFGEIVQALGSLSSGAGGAGILSMATSMLGIV